jgi:hypothetical protein
LNTLLGHTSGVLSLAFADEKLFSGSFDHTIRVWDVHTGTCLDTLLGHTDTVKCFTFAVGKLISGSRDGHIKVWDLQTLECLYTFRRHINYTIGGSVNYSIDSIAFADGKLVIAYGADRSNPDTLIICDFRATDHKILEEIADQLESRDPRVVAEAMDRFGRMPKKAKDKAYRKLLGIFKRFRGDYPGFAEEAFHDQHGQSSTPAQKAQAIRKSIAPAMDNGNVSFLSRFVSYFVF